MEEEYFKVWKEASENILAVLRTAQEDEKFYNTDFAWSCAKSQEKTWRLSADQLAACGCRNCARQTVLRFFEVEREKAAKELDRLGVAGPLPNGKWLHDDLPRFGSWWY